MADISHPKKRKLPIRKVIIWSMAGMVLFSYGLVSIPPETESPITVKLTIIGLVEVIIGAVLWIAAFFYQRAEP